MSLPALPKNPCHEDPRHAAVQSRDASQDAHFVYAVRSTGIYCRPSCPARRPAPHRIAFFDTPDDAERAGFRPCRRCRPREANAQAQAVQAACRHMEAHADQTLTLDALGAQVGLSPHHFQRLFRRLTGVSPREYAAACRLARFKAELQDGQPVVSALTEAGYGSTSRVYENAAATLGMTPTAYRQGGQVQTIVYATAATPLGALLVATTPKGICAVTLGDTDTDLEAALRREYPAAEIARDNGALAETLQMLLRHLDSSLPDMALPTDVRATAFQRCVWQHLQTIPPGETRSYAQVAAALGQPSATRAVARACAANPTALLVPCHRVVRADGSVSGYRWGAARKQALLDRERSAAASGSL